MINIISLLRDEYTRQDGTSSVILQLYIKRQRVVLPTGLHIDPVYWDPERRLVKPNHEKASDYNLIIEKCRSQVNDILIRYRLAGKEITPRLLKVEFSNPTQFIFFTDWTKHDILGRKGIIASSTIEMHLSVINDLEKFQKKITFAEIDFAFLERFEKYLRNKKNAIDTISKKMRIIKLYLNRAKRAGVIKKTPFEDYKIKRGKGRIIYLEDPELKKMVELYNRELCPHNMKKVLKYFLFACLTGLRISDVKKLSFTNIINDIIVLIPQKKMNTDHETVTIPLCRSAKMLLFDGNELKVRGRIFDTYTDPATNRYLKDIAKLLEIKKRITFHVARHTFATLFLEKTNDLATLQKLMGHFSINQTMVYAHVSEVKKRQQIKVFDDIL